MPVTGPRISDSTSSRGPARIRTRIRHSSLSHRPRRSDAMKQRWALVLMGGWLAGTVCMSVVATENFYTIDRLLAGSPSAPFTALVHRLGRPQTRELLRYLSSELNRLYFQLWNVAQLVIGALVLWLIDRGQTRGSGLTAVE